MSAVASPSLAVVSSNSNSSVICNKPSKRRSGTFRVLMEDYAQFTLGDEFDNDFHQVFSMAYTQEQDPVTDEPLINSCKNVSKCLDETRNKNTLKGSYVSHHSREISRLTDEVEIDGDSTSDELDLLPPLPSYSGSKRTFPKWKIKLPNWLLCRNHRIPIKCIIM